MRAIHEGVDELSDVVYGTAITTGEWTQLTSNGEEITPTGGASDTVVAIVEVDSADKPLAYGRAVLNIG